MEPPEKSSLETARICVAATPVECPRSTRRTFLSRSACGLLAGTGLLREIRPCAAAAGGPPVWEIDDPDGALGFAEAPVAVPAAAAEQPGQGDHPLFVREQGAGGEAPLLPVQRLQGPGGSVLLCWRMTPGKPGKRRFQLEPGPEASPPGVSLHARRNAAGQYEIREGETPVFRYNFAAVEPGEVLIRIRPNSRKYAVARSDYLHPLFGPAGEELTADWSIDHPHHRGIYWAWPEVDWRGRRGDLHALQKVFARPVGECAVCSGPVFAEVSAENTWVWEDGTPVVRERAVLRAYRAGRLGRLVDLEFRFAACGDPVAVARRDTTHYGGLNLRFSAIGDQQITAHTDPPGAGPRRAWGAIRGTFAGAAQPAEVVILQSRWNPAYPDDWVQYPNLNWLQPAFPASGTRHEITRERPLVLHYRLWIHAGASAGDDACARQWDAANSPFVPSTLRPHPR